MKILTLSSEMKERLSHVKPPLRTLYYEGASMEALLKKPRVAIVGSRKPTPYGLRVTDQLATELARAGVVIVSGLAFGVDVAAHKAALRACGSTIAVLPSGLENPYPASHSQIADSITQNGAIISECEKDHTPRAHDFLDRNRLIAGISDVVIVTEAAERSGSLNTASHATAMGVPVAAVPGQIFSAMSSGTNSLIKQGAHIVRNVDDVLDLLHLTNDGALSASFNEVESELVRLLRDAPCDTTQLCATSNIPLDDLQVELTSLEIEGIISQNEIGVWYVR